MTSARIVTPGQAMAKIPTTMARMPSRINETDDDLNMTGIPSAYLSRVLLSRHDGRPWRPISAAYRRIAGGYATVIVSTSRLGKWLGSGGYHRPFGIEKHQA